MFDLGAWVPEEAAGLEEAGKVLKHREKRLDLDRLLKPWRTS